MWRCHVETRCLLAMRCRDAMRCGDAMWRCFVETRCDVAMRCGNGAQRYALSANNTHYIHMSLHFERAHNVEFHAGFEIQHDFWLRTRLAHVHGRAAEPQYFTRDPSTTRLTTLSLVAPVNRTDFAGIVMQIFTDTSCTWASCYKTPRVHTEIWIQMIQCCNTNDEQDRANRIRLRRASTWVFNRSTFEHIQPKKSKPSCQSLAVRA